uniref:Uncharacterized protein n=1 Tax=Zooxanthella nutricula TaxID=1333877 RepID=A0A7S2Q4E8_9DINO
MASFHSDMENQGDDEDTFATGGGLDAIKVSWTRATRCFMSSVDGPFVYKGRVDRSGRPVGNGTLFYGDDVIAYVGGWRDGRKHGLGTSYHRDGSVEFQGMWRVGEPELQTERKPEEAPPQSMPAKWSSESRAWGTQSVGKADEFLYSGAVDAAGRPTGHGILLRRDRSKRMWMSVYVGQWVEGRKHGSGSSFSLDGSLYFAGVWKDNVPVTQGTEVFKDFAASFIMNTDFKGPEQVSQGLSEYLESHTCETHDMPWESYVVRYEFDDFWSPPRPMRIPCAYIVNDDVLQDGLFAAAKGDTVSIPALEDKLMVHEIVDGFDVEANCPGVGPILQLPVLQWQQELSNGTTAQGRLAHSPDRLQFGAIVKPTHLAHGTGFSRIVDLDGQPDVVRQKLEQAVHAEDPNLNQAAQLVRKGAIIQPAYPSIDDVHGPPEPGTRPDWTKAPLELRVQVAWGRVFMAASHPSPGSWNILNFIPQRDEAGEVASWSAHAIPVSDDARETFQQMGTDPEMRMLRRETVAFYQERHDLAEYLLPFLSKVAPQAECLAKAFAVPWARFDFFVPPPGVNSSEWPVVLNEVEYKSGVQWQDYTGKGAIRKLGTPGDELANYRNAYKLGVYMGSRAAAGVLAEGWRAREQPNATAKGGEDVFKALGCEFGAGEPASYATMRCSADAASGRRSTGWFFRGREPGP